MFVKFGEGFIKDYVGINITTTENEWHYFGVVFESPEMFWNKPFKVHFFYEDEK